MANGINPYLTSNVEVLSNLAQTSGEKNIEESLSQTGIQKGKLKKRFLKEQEDALAKFKKKSKGGIFGALSKFAPLIAMINPLAGSILSGVGTAGRGIETRKAAKDLPGMEGWKTTFLSEAAKGREGHYKHLKESAPSILDSLVSGAVSGVTAHSMGKATKGAFGGDEAIKMFGKDKTEGKFFEKLTKKLGERTKEQATKEGGKVQKGFFERMQSDKDFGIKENKLLDKNWLKLLQTYPELSKGNLTDAVSVISGMGQNNKFTTKEELDAALASKKISQSDYDELIKQFEGGQ